MPATKVMVQPFKENEFWDILEIIAWVISRCFILESEKSIIVLYLSNFRKYLHYHYTLKYIMFQWIIFSHVPFVTLTFPLSHRFTAPALTPYSFPN